MQFLPESLIGVYERYQILVKIEHTPLSLGCISTENPFALFSLKSHIHPFMIFLVSFGTELTFFLVASSVLCFGLRTRIMRQNTKVLVDAP